MTARNERVVRARTPGKASDRRNTVGRRSRPSRDSYPTSFAANPGGWPIAKRRSALKPSDLEQEKGSRSSSGIDELPSPFDLPLGISGGRSNAPPEQVLGDRISFRDVSLILSRLESHRGAFRLLSQLRFCGPSTMYEMRHQVALGQRALKAALAVLLELKLIEEGRPRPFPYSRSKSFCLSERGQALMRTPVEEWSLLLRFWSYV